MVQQLNERRSPIPFVVGFLVLAFVIAGNLTDRSSGPVGERQGQIKAATKHEQPIGEHGKPERTAPMTVKPNTDSTGNVHETGCENCTSAEKSDLREQRRMAEAAERQLWLSGVGLLALIVTLAVTAWTAHEARRAADATTASVAVAADTAKRQLRAYVDVDQAEITHRDEFGQVAAGVRLKNSGQTPAYDVECWYVIGWRPYPFLPGSFDPLRERDGESRTTIGGAGGGANLLLENVPPLSTDTEYLAGTLAIVVYGEVSYRDAFDHRQTTGFRLYNIGDLGPRRLRKALEGNYST